MYDSTRSCCSLETSGPNIVCRSSPGRPWPFRPARRARPRPVELVLVDEQPAPAVARLPGVEVDAHERAGDRRAPDRRREDDVRGLAAQLERQALQRPAGLAPISPSDLVEPVNAILSTSGWSTIAAPVSPVAGHDVDHPGRESPPRSASSPIRSAVSGVCSAGFSTTVQPAPAPAPASRPPSAAGSSTG